MPPKSSQQAGSSRIYWAMTLALLSAAICAIVLFPWFVSRWSNLTLMLGVACAIVFAVALLAHYYDADEDHDSLP